MGQDDLMKVEEFVEKDIFGGIFIITNKSLHVIKP